MRISDWSSDVCSSDLCALPARAVPGGRIRADQCDDAQARRGGGGGGFAHAQRHLSRNIDAGFAGLIGSHESTSPKEIFPHPFVLSLSKHRPYFGIKIKSRPSTSSGRAEAGTLSSEARRVGQACVSSW